MSILWPAAPVDRRQAFPETDVEKMAYYNANVMYEHDLKSWYLGIAARVGFVALVGGYFLLRKK
jgi:hypothetical protein